MPSPPPLPSAPTPAIDPLAPVLAARGIAKAFGPITVLDRIELDFVPGEIHAVVGENGAGKSTLMKILAGVIAPTRGEIHFQQRPVPAGNLRQMESLGIRFIHQELNLAEDLTVLENLFLGVELVQGPFLRDRRMRQIGSEVLARVGARIRLNARVSSLRVSEKQLIEIARVIAQPLKVLILDEPTAALTQRESERLFQIIEAAAAESVAVIYISHRLEEVKRLAHRITILRDGLLVTTRRAAELAPDEIVRLMVGRDVRDLFPAKQSGGQTEPLLEVRDLSVPGLATNISFDLRTGEILGFAGLIGAGRTELWEGIVGLRQISGGSVRKSGKPVRSGAYDQSLEQMRAVYLPEDRKGRGLLVAFDAPTNYSLLGLKRFGAWFVRARPEKAAFRQAVSQFKIKVPDRRMPVSRLSGGNQQKILLAKVLTVDPEIIIFDEPTRGIDVGTKAEVYQWIVRMAAEGRACVVISSELLEIIGLCHRVLVMRNARLVADLSSEQITEDEIMLYATGVKAPQTIPAP